VKEFLADLHIHSHYSRATSKESTPEEYHRWACLKGLGLLGTGDCTHPGWREELRGKLERGDDGLYMLRDDLRDRVEDDLPPSCRKEVRFVPSAEISCIYKKAGRTRKIHILLILPDLEAAERLSEELSKIGNLESDGRPILGLDAKALFEIVLEVSPESLYIPAHIWTPHFSLFGANSGFDAMEECFEELTPHIAALETGLSSDPPMNWRLSALDPFPLVSHSDAHSPKNLAREADVFRAELSYEGLRKALRGEGEDRLLGTLEFYPEEGKYHYDGHRSCGVRWHPRQTIRAGGICPVCGRKVTVGVLHRVEELADRPEGVRPPSARPYESLVPLPEVIGDALGTGAETKKVQNLYRRLLSRIGPELFILREAPLEDISRVDPLVAEGVRRVRERELEVLPGYDGEYGKVRVFREGEREKLRGQVALIELPSQKRAKSPEPVLTVAPPRTAEEIAAPEPSRGLDPSQEEAVCSPGPVVVVAGPGTGKTRTLAHRAARLIREGVPPEHIAAVTFTNRAAGEMRERARSIVGEEARGVWTGTFHSLCLELLRGIGGRNFRVVDDIEARSILEEVLVERREKGRISTLYEALCRVRARGEDGGELLEAYRKRLREYGLWDYEELLWEAVNLLRDPEVLEAARRRFWHVLVDEFQDVNLPQYKLVRLLAGSGEGLFVIGDPDQAIYGFRGADYRFFLRLREDFPDAHWVYLETSYRCPAPLLSAARHLISHNHDRLPGKLRAHRNEGPKVRLLRPSSELAEGIAVVREIGRMVGGATMLQASGGSGDARSFGDFAVLFRTARQAEVLEECFLKEGLPYRVVGGRGFLEEPSVRGALAFFRFLLDPQDPLRIRMVLSEGPFAVPPGDRERASELVLKGDWRGPLVRLRDVLEVFRGVEGEPAREAIRRWIDAFGEDGHLVRLQRLAEGRGTLRDFLETLPLYRDGDYERRGEGPPTEAVSLMTLHAAKGLEFPVVFIVGVEEGLLPHEDGDVEEERRLFYVGMTRAKEELVLSAARSRTVRGRRVELPPSRFLDELPQDLVVRETPGPRKRRTSSQLSLF